MSSSSVNDIIHIPDERLRKNSQRVSFITEETESIISKMKEATLAWEAKRDNEVGVALAAVQVGELERIVIIRSNPENKNSHAFEVFINPEITKREGDLVSEPEGCLSIPDLYGLVPRYEAIRIKAMDEEGREVRLKIKGFLARVFQHEVDHLHGKLFVDHVEDNKFYKIEDDGKLTPLPDQDIESNRVLWNC